MKNKNLAITGIVIGALTLVLSAYILSNSHFNIRTTQTEVTEEGLLTNSISVSGDGTATAKPDVAYLTVGINSTQKTVNKAQDQVNKKVSSIVEIATKNGVKKEDITTLTVNIRPEYKWENNKSKFIGYTASQRLKLEIPYNVDDENSSVSRILDDISSLTTKTQVGDAVRGAIPNPLGIVKEKLGYGSAQENSTSKTNYDSEYRTDVTIDSIAFDVKDKKELSKQARELAYKSAEEKARQLAELSGVKLGKPISIRDSSAQYNQIDTNYALRSAKLDMAAEPVSDNFEPTQVFGGDQEVKVVLNVVFAIE